MTKTAFEDKYSGYLEEFITYAKSVFQNITIDNRLIEAMKYSFFAGGKRIRPVLMLAFNEVLGGKSENVIPFAFALECIHTYSLIHDDLPALDNDLLRRGKPSCHAVFGEATAILAGDALLNFAFEHALKAVKNKRQIKALSYLADCSGYSGMLGGQMEDIENEKSKGLKTDYISGDKEKLLNDIYEKKTGKFLTAPFKIAAIISDEGKIELAERIGSLFGRAFQYADDLKDVYLSPEQTGKSAGKDEAEGKLTSVAVYGADKVKSLVSTYENQIENLLKTLANSEFLRVLTKSVLR